MSSTSVVAKTPTLQQRPWRTPLNQHHRQHQHHPPSSSPLCPQTPTINAAKTPRRRLAQDDSLPRMLAGISLHGQGAGGDCGDEENIRAVAGRRTLQLSATAKRVSATPNVVVRTPQLQPRPDTHATPTQHSVFLTSKPDDVDTPTWMAFLQQVYPDEATLHTPMLNPTRPPATTTTTTNVDALLDQAMRRLSLTKRSPAAKRSPLSVKHDSPSASKHSLLTTPGGWMKRRRRRSSGLSACSSSTATATIHDRFITHATIDQSAYQVDKPSVELLGDGASYRREVAKACGVALDQRILSCHGRSSTSGSTASSSCHRASAAATAGMMRPLKPATTHARRKIPTAAEKILDAPGMGDMDVRGQLLDWSSTNVLAVCLGPSVYVWNASTGETKELYTCRDGTDLTNVGWSFDGRFVAIGDRLGRTHLINVERGKRVRTLRCHGRTAVFDEDGRNRVSALAWNRGALTVGSARTGTLHQHDVRLAQSEVAQIRGHEGAVSAARWHGDGQTLATGGEEDHLVKLWDIRRAPTPLKSMSEHTAAVRALSWCPWQSDLLSSGSVDTTIRFWSSSGTATQSLSTLHTAGPVTGVHWSKTYKEFVSTHDSEQAEFSLWKYPSLGSVMSVPHAHDASILCTALSPDGQTLCTASADENIKFWRVFAFDPRSVKVRRGGEVDWRAGQVGRSPDFGGTDLR